MEELHHRKKSWFFYFSSISKVYTKGKQILQLKKYLFQYEPICIWPLNHSQSSSSHYPTEIKSNIHSKPKQDMKEKTWNSQVAKSQNNSEKT